MTSLTNSNYQIRFPDDYFSPSPLSITISGILPSTYNKISTVGSRAKLNTMVDSLFEARNQARPYVRQTTTTAGFTGAAPAWHAPTAQPRQTYFNGMYYYSGYLRVGNTEIAPKYHLNSVLSSQPDCCIQTPPEVAYSVSTCNSCLCLLGMR